MLRAVVVAVCIFAVSSCDNLAAGYSRAGVRRDGSSVLVRYLACPDEEVRSVILYRLDGDKIAPDDDGDVVLWEATGSELDDLGGRGVVPTVGGRAIRLEPRVSYLLDIETSANLVGTDAFRIDELDSSEFRVDLRNLSEADFAKQASDSCK